MLHKDKFAIGDKLNTMNKENNESGSLFSGQEPHQKEDMEQATKASGASFNLEPEKGISPDPDQYNGDDEQGNIKQMSVKDKQDTMAGGGAGTIDNVYENPDLNKGEFDVTQQDLETLDAQDKDLDDDGDSD